MSTQLFSLMIMILLFITNQYFVNFCINGAQFQNQSPSELIMPSNFQTGCGIILVLLTLFAILATVVVMRFTTYVNLKEEKDFQTKTG